MIKRIITIIKGLFLSLIGKAEQSNPKAILEAEKEKLRENMAKYDEKVAQHKGKVIKAQTKLEKLLKDKEDTKSKVKNFITMGNKEVAGKFAKKLQSIESGIDDLEEFVSHADEIYETLMADRAHALNTAKEIIEEIARGIDEAELNESMADMKEIAKDFGDELSNSSLSRLKASVDERAAEAKGRVEIAKDIAEEVDPTTTKEYREASNANALAAFMDSEGMTPTAPTENKASISSDYSMGLGSTSYDTSISTGDSE